MFSYTIYRKMHPGRLVRSCFLILSCLALIAAACPASGSEQGPVCVLWDGSAECPVVFVNVPEAKEFEKRFLPLLRTMTGAEFPVRALKSWDGVPVPAIVFDLQEADPGDQNASMRDEFRIRTEDGRVVISSRSARGLHYGFYELMERFGCQFWSFSEQTVPKLDKLELRPVDYAWTAPFLIHDIMSREAQTAENDFCYKSRATSPVEFTGNHTLYPLLTPYAKQHPDIYPLVQEKDSKTGAVLKEARKANDLHFCYSAPGIAEALADALEKEVVKRKGDLRKYIYFAGMGDWYGGQCQCVRCEAIYSEEAWTNPDGKVLPGYTGTLLRMINQAAEILEKKHPGILVGTFAYMSLEAPPAKTKPRNNVVIYVPRLRHCGTHAADECGKNRQFWLSLNRWCELAPQRVYVWEYGANFTNFLYPFPTLAAIARNISAYKTLGVEGVMIQGNYVSTGGDMVVLNNYVFSRMLRDPSQDVQKLIADSMAGYYGPAAPAVGEYYQKLRAAVGDLHVDEFSEAARYLTPPVIVSLRECLQKAGETVSGPGLEDYRRRVEELAVGVEAAELWKQGPLMERDGRLIRKDLGCDTYDRAVRLAENNRNSTPREFGSGRGYWLDFLRWHGGPLAKLERGPLVVKAAPAQNAAIGPVLLDGKAVLSKTWLPTIRHGVLVGDGETIRMDGETGIGAWSPNTKYVVSQEIRFADDGTIEVSALAEKMIEEPSTLFEIKTIYPNQNALFEFMNTEGKWVAAEKPQKAAPVPTGPIRGWRVSSVAGEVTDIYEALSDQPGEGGTDASQKRAPYSGEIGFDQEVNKIYTSIMIPAAIPHKGGKLPWLRRTIKIKEARTE